MSVFPLYCFLFVHGLSSYLAWDFHIGWFPLNASKYWRRGCRKKMRDSTRRLISFSILFLFWLFPSLSHTCICTARARKDRIFSFPKYHIGWMDEEMWSNTVCHMSYVSFTVITVIVTNYPNGMKNYDQDKVKWNLREYKANQNKKKTK